MNMQIGPIEAKQRARYIIARQNINAAGRRFLAERAANKAEEEARRKAEAEQRKLNSVWARMIFAISARTSKQKAARTILNFVSHRYGVTIEQIKGGARRQIYLQPRYEAYWLMRRLTDYSLPIIGREVGGRDHTTVMHGISGYDRWRRVRDGLEQPVPRDVFVDYSMLLDEDITLAEVSQ